MARTNSTGLKFIPMIIGNSQSDFKPGGFVGGYYAAVGTAFTTSAVFPFPSRYLLRLSFFQKSPGKPLRKEPKNLQPITIPYHDGQ